MAHIRIGDEHFNVAVDGPREAPVLMMSNSLGTDLRMWDPQMPELTKHFRVIRYDSRGHGASPADEGPYSIEKLGRDAIAILDKLGVEKAHWVGLSKGGMVGQWMLTNAPQRIVRAVLANTSSYMGGGDIWDNRARAAREQGMAALAEMTLERWFTADFRRKNPELMARIIDMISRTPAHGYAACCLAIRDMDQRDSIRSIRKPVLVIVGKHDPATTPAAGNLIAATIPGAKVVTLNAAHLSNIEDPDAFTSSVISFLTGKSIGEAPSPAANDAAPAPAKPKSVTLVRVKTARPVAPQPAPAAPKAEPAAEPAAKSSKSDGKKAAAKKKTAKKPAGKKAAAKKGAARKTKAAAKKPARKAAAGKTTARKGPVKKSAAKKGAGKKSVSKKTASKKSTAKKPARKAVAKKSAAKKKKSR